MKNVFILVLDSMEIGKQANQCANQIAKQFLPLNFFFKILIIII